jgi:hypothetical protein
MLLGLFERCFLHQEALPLVPPARPAPPDHDRRKDAGLLRPAGQRGVAGRQEHQVIHLGAGQAERPLIVHDQQAARAAALGTGPVLDRLNDNQIGRSGLALGDAFAFSGGSVGGNPL